MKTKRFLEKAALLLALAAISAVTTFAEEAAAPSTDEQRKMADSALYGPLMSMAFQSCAVTTHSRQYSDRLMKESSDPVTAGFFAARVAWLSGRPSEAIERLDVIVQKYGDLPNTQSNIANGVQASLWIGAIAREYGDARRAQAAYDHILERARGDKVPTSMAVLSNLYEAEIAEAITGNNEIALNRLKKVAAAEAPGDKGQAAYRLVCREWAEYDIARLTRGTEEARALLKGDRRKYDACLSLARSILDSNGVTAEPRPGVYLHGGEILLRACLEQVIEYRTSPIDKALAQLVLASTYEERGDAAEAEKHYGEVFAGETYFAPEGGVHLACFQNRQGKAKDAHTTFAQVRERFPGYAQLVDDLSKESVPPPPSRPNASEPPARGSVPIKPQPQR